MSVTLPAPDQATNHWEDYSGLHSDWVCRHDVEFCTACGRQLVEHIAFDKDRRSSRTGLPTYARRHSCPTWITGWRASRWARGWAAPGYGHDSHDADNPLSARGYR